MKSKYLKTYLTPLLFIALWPCPGPLHGAELFSDTFAYDEGPLVGALESIWEPHSQAGNGPVSISAGRMALRFDQFEDINAPLTNGPYTVDGDVPFLYTQFLLEATDLPTVAGTYFAHFRSGNTHRARVWISTENAADGFYRIGIGNSSGADANSGQIPMDLETNRTYRVVFRYQLATGSSAIAIDPVTESDLIVNAIDPVGLSSVSSMAFRQSREIGSLWIDNVLVTDEFPGSLSNEVVLKIQTQTEGLMIRWSTNVTDYILESAPTIDAPVWIEEEGPVTVDSGWNVYRVPTTDQSRFYRLKQL